MLYSETKVVPVKQQTLALLELQACLLGVNVLQLVAGQLRLKVQSIHAWSESWTLLNRIQCKSYRWKTYVAYRFSEIQDPNGHWHHYPVVDNPADLVRCGADVTVWQQQEGPAWLL